MDIGHRLLNRIHDQDGLAVGYLNEQRMIGPIGGQGVAIEIYMVLLALNPECRGTP